MSEVITFPVQKVAFLTNFQTSPFGCAPICPPTPHVILSTLKSYEGGVSIPPPILRKHFLYLIAELLRKPFFHTSIHLLLSFSSSFLT